MAEIEAPYREGAHGAEGGDAHPGREGPAGHPREGPDARAEAAGRRASATTLAGHLGGGRRGRRRGPRPTTPSASGSSARSTRSSSPCPGRRRRRMALVDERSRRRPRRSSSAGATSKNRGPQVAPRPPGVVLASQPTAAFDRERDRADRPRPAAALALARWLTRPDNPLTARVIVNRLWQHHFGRGIVATPSDFGVRGEPPTPSRAARLAGDRAGRPGLAAQADPPADGHLGRLSPGVDAGRARQKQAADDPENTLLWRMNRRRMDAEGLRDAMLAASGELNLKAGGPGVLVPIEKEVEDLIFTEAEVVDLWPETPDPAEHLRRSLYLFRKRNVRYPLFDAFDAPDTQTACPQRHGQHPRPPGPRPAQQRLRRRPGQGPRRPALPRGAGRRRDRVALRLPDRPGPRADARRSSTQAVAFLASQAELLRQRGRGQPSPGRRPCPTGPTPPRPRPGSTSAWRCSTGTNSSTSPDARPEPIADDSAAPRARRCPGPSAVRRRAAASSSARRATASACSGCRTCSQQEAGRPAAAGEPARAAGPAISRRRRSGASSCS